MTDPWTAQMEALGAYIRSQRELARLSLRQMAELTRLSHPYLSQVERGVHQPSVRVLKAIAEALNVSAETLLAQAGLFSGEEPAAADSDDPEVPTAQQVADVIKSDPRLTEAQKAALIAVYASMLRDDEGSGPGPADGRVAGGEQ